MNDKTDNEKFEFTYSAPTEQERREINGIRAAYVERTSDGIYELRKMNKRVTLPPTVAGWIIGVVGTLVLGTGMAMSLEWDLTAWGVVVGLIGIALVAVAYPIYKAILGRNKRKYAKQIIELSDKLLNTENEK